MKLKKKYKYLIITVALFISTGFAVLGSDFYIRVAKSINIFGEVYKVVANSYVDKINPEELMKAGINGMLSALDPYTVFVDEINKGDIDLIMKGKYGGIGATIGLRNDKVTVVDILEGYSAQRQGIIIGDVIIQVDDTKLTKDNYDELSTYMKGKPGTMVTLTIQREGTSEEIIFNLVREEIEVRNLTYYGFVPAESNNAYMKLSGFSRTAGAEVKDALIELVAKKEIKSIVLDLRGNPGGLLDAAIDVTEKFIGKGELIVSVMGRDSSSVKRYKSAEKPIADKSKLVVLVDKGSASASEIVAGAIQDHDRGVILGTRSFGKGLVQTLIPLVYNTSVKITTSKYYTPSGRCIQEIDYSNKNKILDRESVDENRKFTTDNNRTVFSKGGIAPDTVINGGTKSKLVEQLLAKGFFFQFATYLSNSGKVKIIDSKNSDFVFDEFVKYLHEHNFEYDSQTEKLLTLLKNTGKAEGYNSNFLERVGDLSSNLDQMKSDEIHRFEKDIMIAIKLEMIGRDEGRTGRIKGSLQHDKQFNTAYQIISDNKVYSKLLAASE